MTELNVLGDNLPKGELLERPKLPVGFSGKDFILWTVGLLMSMAMPYGTLTPFGLSFLAGERRFSLKAVISLIVVGLGSFFVCTRLDWVKYLSAGMVYLAALFVLENGIMLNRFTSALVAGISLFFTGFITLIWQDFSIFGVMMLLFEAVAVVAGAVVFEKTNDILREERVAPEKITSEEKLSLGAVALMCVLGLRWIYLGTEFSVMNAVAAAMLLVVAKGCGVAYSTGAGVILGAVCGIGGDYFLPLLGAFSFCGFLSGLCSKLGRSGVIGGMILANALLIVYTDGAMESVLTLYEIMAAAVMFAFVKEGTMGRVSRIILLDSEEKKSIAQMKETLRTRLAAVSASLESMAKSMERARDKKEKEDNLGDVATFFDMAADKVCRRCKKNSTCWGKDFDSTYKSLFALMEEMKENGTIEEADAEPSFRARCIQLPRLINEINHQLDIHQVRCVWKSKVKESHTMVGEQIFNIAKIVGDLSQEMGSDIRFDNVTAEEIREKAEDRGLRIREIRVFREQNGRHRIEMTVRTSWWNEKTKREMKKLMKSVLGGEVRIKESVSGNKTILKLEVFQAEKFMVETDFAEKAASDENGDNYRFSLLSGGKYVVALSDGMGTGSRAAKESQAMLELLDSFLSAGFESSVAVKFINSIMLLRSDEESFVTIDICIIDLYTGMAEFIKTGAEPSFLMRQGRVDTVKAASLPVGIVADMEAETATRPMDDGDMIVMVTDGIETRDGGSMWIGDFLENACRQNDEDNIADKILDHAIRKNNGEVKDDMTVLSVKLRAVS